MEKFWGCAHTVASIKPCMCLAGIARVQHAHHMAPWLSVLRAPSQASSAKGD